MTSLIILLVTTLLASEFNTENNPDCFRLENLKRSHGQRLESLDYLSKCYQLKDTILTDLDVSWDGLTAYSDGELSILFESNWVNRADVSRITIFSQNIRTKENLSVGCDFGEIRDYVSVAIPPAPDGFLFLSSKSDPMIFFQLDLDGIPNTSALKTGVGDINLIPSNLKVKSIIVSR